MMHTFSDIKEPWFTTRYRYDEELELRVLDLKSGEYSATLPYALDTVGVALRGIELTLDTLCSFYDLLPENVVQVVDIAMAKDYESYPTMFLSSRNFLIDLPEYNLDLYEDVLGKIELVLREIMHQYCDGGWLSRDPRSGEAIRWNPLC